jgi:hypothetical protein
MKDGEIQSIGKVKKSAKRKRKKVKKLWCYVIY